MPLAAAAARATPPYPLDTFGGLRTNFSSLSFGSSFRNMRRSATEAQLGLEFGGVSKMEFEFDFEFLFPSGLQFTFKLEFEFEFEFDFEFKSELAFEVAHSSWSSNSLLHRFIFPRSDQAPKKLPRHAKKTFAELNLHINLVRKLPFRDPKLVSKRPSGRPEWNTSGNLRPRN